MNEAHRLWDENSREIWVGDGPIDIMLEKDFIDFFSKYNPWITDREPTREEWAEGNGAVEIWVEPDPDFPDDIGYCDTVFHGDVYGRPWRKIVKPKI